LSDWKCRSGAGQAPNDQGAGASISFRALDSDAEAGRPHEAVRRVIPAAGVIMQAAVIVPAAVITSAAVAEMIDVRRVELEEVV
jgi:hypothetical protein